MRAVTFAWVLALCPSLIAQGEALKAPAGCRPASGAKAAAGGYADRIVHGKTGMEMVFVRAGRGAMGRGRPVHRVTIRMPFYMAKTEVTNGQYRKFVEASGYDGTADTDTTYDLHLRHWRGKSLMSAEDDYPIVWVSWKNAKAFCKWAGVALPSEAQWEYACRAGTRTPYFFGKDGKEFGEYGWAIISKEYHTHAVAGKLPNPWGFHDMLGNVWEWVEDDYFDGYEGAPSDESPRVAGRMTRVLKGGCWGNGVAPYASGSGARYNYAPANAAGEIGFRVIIPLKDPALRLPAAQAGGPVARYTFEEGGGEIVKDSSGNGIDGRNTGAKYIKLPDGKGFALAFQTPEASVDCGDDPVFDMTSAVTVEMWLLPQTGIKKGEVGLVGKGFRSYLVSYAGRCWFYINAGSNHCAAVAAVGAWHHIAATYDGKRMKLYVNGELRSDRKYDRAVTEGGNFYLKVPYAKGAKVEPAFKFMLDDVRIYDRPLSEKEVADHYREEAKSRRAADAE